jgi:hypothetical protein
MARNSSGGETEFFTSTQLGSMKGLRGFGKVGGGKK